MLRGTTARTALRDFERKAHAVFERAAVIVGAPVGDRRHEAVQQVAVRHVQLDGVEADAHRPLGRGHEGVADALDIVAVIARGVAQPGENGSADGAMICHGSGAPAPRASRLTQGTLTDPLRPAWAIWTPILAVPMRLQCATTRASASSQASE